MISIRKLEEKDIPYIIEWMNNENLTKYLKTNFKDIANEKSQLEFIKNSYDNKNKNFAIIDDNDDQYLGSVSLKNIDYNKREAEYAICIREIAQGKNVASAATNRILMFAFSELNLERVYLYVQSENMRANSFYNKYGFNFDRRINNSMEFSGVMKDINWYSITRDGFFSMFKNREVDMTNVKRRHFNVISDNRGDLIALEENPRQLEFPLNRVYYIYNVDEGIIRGKHSHYDLEQMLICVSGSVTVVTKTPFEQSEYILNNPNEGLYIGPMIWREMIHFSKDAVLLVLASNQYDADDYIRDYDLYEKEARKYFRK